MRLQNQDPLAKLLIHCHDGRTKTGLFLAVFNILQQLDRVDFFHIPVSFLNIRETQSSFVCSREQIHFCFQMVLEYLNLQVV